MSCERQEGWTYIICYLAHQSGGKLKENLLHINNLPTIDCFVQKLFGIVKDWWQRFIKEPFEVCIAEKPQSGFPLHLPKVSVSIDDAIACSSRTSMAVSEKSSRSIMA